VLIPGGGVSVLSASGFGGAFEDADADEALFGAVDEGLQGSGVRVSRDRRAVDEGGLRWGRLIGWLS